KVIFTTNFPKGGTLALIKTIVSIISNLIVGVQTNYKYISKIAYSHFPCSVRVDEKNKMIFVENFLGERAPRKAKYPDNVQVEVKGDDVSFIGPDKEALGQAAANVKRACRIRKKDPRVFQDGVYLYKKQIGEEVVWEII
ncbi:MAG: 50S ribosomal protein L6, partial [Promethearchaeota archaeon]